MKHFSLFAVSKTAVFLIFSCFIHSVFAYVAPIKPGEDGWAVVRRIGCELDTVLDKVCDMQTRVDDIQTTVDSVDSKVDIMLPQVNDIQTNVEFLVSSFDSLISSFACAPGPIIQTSGSIILSIPGNYCLANDFVGTIAIIGNDITLDLNNRRVTGTVSITNANRVNLLSGYILPTATTSNSDPAALTITTSSDVLVNKCVINCSNAVGNGINGRNGIVIVGADAITNSIKILDCEIISGSASIATGFVTPAGGVGGSGILVSNINYLKIENCFVSTGSGGDGASFGSGGNSGTGLSFLNSNYCTVKNCFIVTSTGGSSFGGSPAFGGTGIVSTELSNSIIENVTIIAGNGGSNSSGNGGIGGHGISLSSSNNVSIQNISITAGIGGNGVGGGVGGDGIVLTSCSIMQIENATVVAGKGGDGGGALGGNGINLSSCLVIEIENSTVVAGDGGNIGGTGGIGLAISNSQKTKIKNTRVQSGNGIMGIDSAIGSVNGGSGGTGIFLSGTINTQIEDTIVLTGSGSNGGSSLALINSINGGDGGAAGIGIRLLNAINTIIEQSNIILGNTGNGGNGGIGFNTSGGNGGSGNAGISLTSAINTQVTNCIVQTSNGGNGGTGTGFTGNAGNGGIGILVDNASSPANSRNKIQYCTLSGGDAGLGLGGTGVGGDGVQINANAQLTEVSNCVIAKAGTGATNGIAVNDLNTATTTTPPSTGSAIFDNTAYNIANTIRYRIHNVANPADQVFDATGGGAVTANNFRGNYYFL